MPRLTESDYLHHRLTLRNEWLGGAYALVVLTPTEQIAIHNFYEPSLGLTDKELRKHHAQATARDASLPHRAGKAYARIAPFLEGAPMPRLIGTSVVSQGKRRDTYSVTTVRSLVNPHIDPARMAQILVWAAMDEVKRERLKTETEESDRDAA